MRLIDADKLLFSLEEWELNETPISTYPKPKEFTADDMQRMIWGWKNGMSESMSLRVMIDDWEKENENR